MYSMYWAFCEGVRLRGVLVVFLISLIIDRLLGNFTFIKRQFMVWSKKYLLALALIGSATLNAQTLLVGDTAAATGDTFSFDVLQKYFHVNTSVLFVGREDATSGGDTDDVKKYAVSAINPGATHFIPLSPEKSWVNGTANSNNPLYGEKISLLSYSKSGPLVVRADAPEHLYYLASGTGIATVSVLKVENVKDAQGATNADGSTTAGIVKIVGTSNYSFAAVKKNGGDFGVSGAGIALVKEITNGLEQVAAVTGDTGVKALPLNLSSSELLIGSDLVSIDASILDMHWDGILQRLYICVKATGDTDSADGARGVVVAYVEGVGGVPKLKFSAFAPAAAFSGTTYIVGGKGSSTVADIEKVRTMHTSTGVSYLVTLGNSASSAATTTVSVLPLVNKKPASKFAGDVAYLTDTAQGTLASKTVSAGTNLKEYFKVIGEISTFIGRGFQVAASATAHLTAQTDVAAQVGGAAAPGTVLDMQVQKDVVYISVNGSNDEAQVFSSQALLDVDGAIKGWTPWRPVMRPLTSADRAYGMGYQPSVGRMFTMEGGSSSTVKKVKTSTWLKPSSNGHLGGTTSDGSLGFEALISAALTKENGGIQGLFDFPRQTTAFSQTAGERLSVMIATGYKKIMLIETGQDDGSNNFTPNIGSFFHADNVAITDGVFDTARTANTKTITISGGALDTVGAISTATVINETSNGGYIVVGGVGGVAILRATSGGLGWASGDLQKAFENISDDKSFIAIGSYTHVRKVIADGQFLYVLTDKTFDRIPADELNGTITPIVLATPTDLGLQTFDSFSDVLVSSKLALLATSKGLYRTGNTKNITTETTAANVDWTVVTLTEGPTPVTRLVPVGTTNLEVDFAQQTGGGMVYVLASSVGEQLSSVYRLAIRDISSSAIGATTVEFIPDDILSTVVGPHAHFGAYKNYFITDGSLSIATRSSYNTAAVLAHALPSGLTAGSVLSPKSLVTIPLFAEQLEIGKLVPSSALGSKIIPTSDGLLILE